MCHPLKVKQLDLCNFIQTCCQSSQHRYESLVAFFRPRQPEPLLHWCGKFVAGRHGTGGLGEPEPGPSADAIATESLGIRLLTG